MTIGIVYTAIGILLRLLYRITDIKMSKCLGRISLNFICTGIVIVAANILVPSEIHSLMITVALVATFIFITLLELNRNYRDYRDIIED